MSVDFTKVKDDLYEAVNGEWIKSAEIPADKSATGGFNDLNDDIEKLLMDDFNAMDIASTTDSKMQNFLKFYAAAKDFGTREKNGVAPLVTMLDAIEKIKNFAELNTALPQLILNNWATPFDLDITADMQNASQNVLYISPVGLILPDKTSYADDNPQKAQLLAVYADMVEKVLVLLGKSADDAKKMAEATLRFDASLVPFVKSSEENADYVKSYNPQNFSDFIKSSSAIDFNRAVTAVLKATPETIIVTEPVFFENYDKVVNDDTFSDMMAWMYVNTALKLARLTTEEMRQTSGIYQRTLYGLKEAQSQDKHAFYTAIGSFSHVVGDYYGHKYFGEDAKADVLNMVKKMIGVYKKRLSQNKWLSPDTSAKAIVKLDAITIKVGYPDEIESIYDNMIVTDASLVENAQEFTKLFVARTFSEWNQPVNKKRWGMSANIVNAYYNPSDNEIVFPAAILQAPFYSLEQGAAANYGGIGAVIAHEISHAFDNNGAQFDEVGNLKNWWTEADLTYFKGLAEQMIAAFDGVETPAGKANGRLTVSENIADAGGLSCALEALKGEDEPDFESFFINWATIWRTKSRLAYEQLLLQRDVHGPAKLRANLQVKNLDEFYTTFNVQDGDGMYIAPEKRIAIW